MNEHEAAQLLTYCAAFDNRNPSEAAPAAWASALADVPLDADTKAAVNDYYATSPKDPDGKLWIQPHHVRTLRTKIRARRLENFQYEPVADETPEQYLARYRSQIQAIASGQKPAPAARPVLDGPPSRELMAGLEARGWQGNRTVPDEVAELVYKAGPLGVICPICRAAVGRPCKRPGGTDKHPLGKPRLKPHGARLRAAEGGVRSGDDRGTEEQRIRAMSARYLAREQTEETP